jgi:hypothetical protein
MSIQFLRRHYPDQVRGSKVSDLPLSSETPGSPCIGMGLFHSQYNEGGFSCQAVLKGGQCKVEMSPI